MELCRDCKQQPPIHNKRCRQCHNKYCNHYYHTHPNCKQKMLQRQRDKTNKYWMVYQITNLITGTVYFGQSGNKNRYYYHLNYSRKKYSQLPKHYEMPMYRDMREYGEDNFQFRVLCEFDSKQLAIEIERYLINNYDRGPIYNKQKRRKCQ